jgi:hypothetical protein
VSLTRLLERHREHSLGASEVQLSGEAREPLSSARACAMVHVSDDVTVFCAFYSESRSRSRDGGSESAGIGSRGYARVLHVPRSRYVR